MQGRFSTKKPVRISLREVNGQLPIRLRLNKLSRQKTWLNPLCLRSFDTSWSSNVSKHQFVRRVFYFQLELLNGFCTFRSVWIMLTQRNRTTEARDKYSNKTPCESIDKSTRTDSSTMETPSTVDKIGFIQFFQEFRNDVIIKYCKALARSSRTSFRLERLNTLNRIILTLTQPLNRRHAL